MGSGVCLGSVGAMRAMRGLAGGGRQWLHTCRSEWWGWQAHEPVSQRLAPTPQQR